ncbi:Conserved_hypothetical protein [Hexamita inflata]|uniref:EGF-like domain-containing protein n=1 Tax=Hexamita inflata TaxID=28002 RepID=A0ABP1KHH3_9EUKA
MLIFQLSINYILHTKQRIINDKVDILNQNVQDIALTIINLNQSVSIINNLRICEYSAIKINNSAISNVKVRLDVKLQLDASCDYQYVSLFDYASSSNFSNIAVSGQITLTGTQKNLQMFALVRDYEKCLFTNITSSLNSSFQTLGVTSKSDVIESKSNAAFTASLYSFSFFGNSYQFQSDLPRNTTINLFLHITQSQRDLYVKCTQQQRYSTLIDLSGYETYAPLSCPNFQIGQTCLTACPVLAPSASNICTPVFIRKCQLFDNENNACKNCSRITYYDSCLSSCTENQLDLICLQNCPFYTQTQSKICGSCFAAVTDYMKGTCLPTPNQYYTNENNVQKVICNFNRYSYQNNCTSACPDLYEPLPDLQLCKICQAPTPYQLPDKTCSNTCNGMYAENCICKSTCGSGMYQVVSTVNVCITSCSGYVILNYQNGLNLCVSKCDFYWEQQGSNKVCIPACTQLIVNATQQCVSGCSITPSYPFLYTNLCLQSCSTSPNKFNFNNVCQLTCMPQYVLANMTCASACPQYYNVTSENYCSATCSGVRLDAIISNTRCYTNCAQTGKLYNESFVCKDACTTLPYNNSFVCQANCSKFINSSTNLSCVDLCPSYYAGSTFRICQDTCLTVYLLNGTNKQCLPTCPAGNKYNNTFQCLPSCLPAIPYNNSFTCVQNCPNFVFSQSNLTCMDTCASGFQTINSVKFCVTSCSTVWNPTIINQVTINECIPTCPQNLVNMSNLCSPVCTSPLPYNASGTCAATCQPLFSQNKTCISACPIYTSNLTLPNEKDCLSECSLYILNQNNVNYCVETCPIYYNGQTCVDTCGENAFLNESSKRCQQTCTDFVKMVGQGDNHCVKTCDSFYLENQTINSQLYSVCKNKCVSGHEFVGQNLSCIEVCPRFYEIDAQTNKRCTDACSTNNNFVQSSQCVNTCTSGNFQVWPDANYCVASCEVLFVNVSNQKQCVNECPDGLLYNSSSECVAKCPIFNNGFTCVATCISLNQFVDQNNACTITCNPKIYQLSNGEKICQNKCESLQILGETIECVNKCPEILKYNVTNVCQLSCIQDLQFNDSFTCKNQCDRYVQNTNNKSCVQECDPYFQVSSTDKQKYCIDSCSDKFVEFGQSLWCIPECVDGYEFIDNQYCRSKCVDHPFQNGFICQDSCAKFVKQELDGRYICIDTCSYYDYLNLTGFAPQYLCLQNCPSVNYQTQLFGNEIIQCLDNCQNTNKPYNQTFTCLTNCTSRYVRNNICYDTCLPKYIGLDGVTCTDQCSLYNLTTSQEIQCVPNCLQYIDLNMYCTPQCQPNQYKNGQYCVNVCQAYHNNVTRACQQNCIQYVVIENTFTPKNIYYCVEQCSKYYQIQELPDLLQQSQQQQVCVMSCPHYVLNNQCVDKCPYYYSTNGNDKICQQNCNQFIINQTLECVSQCQDYFVIQQQFGVNVSICLDECTQLVINDTKQCLQQCPNDYQFTYNTFCVNKCPLDKQFNNNSICVVSCQFVAFQGSLTCVNTCSSYFNSTPSYCVPSCPIYQLQTQYGFQCQSECVSPNQYLNNVTCKSQCDLIIPFNNSFTCIQKCPVYVINQYTCIDKCDTGSYNEVQGIKYCQSCNNLYILFNDVKQCVDTCSAPYKFQQDKECKLQCDAIYRNDSYVCVSFCPSSKFNQNGICVNACDHYVLHKQEEDECLQTCQIYVKGKMECLTQCPANWILTGKYCAQPEEFDYITSIC